MKIYQSGLFARKVKKLTKTEKYDLDSVVKEITLHPDIGIEKKGDLKSIFIHKFILQKTEYLLAYRVVDRQALELVMIVPVKAVPRGALYYEVGKDDEYITADDIEEAAAEAREDYQTGKLKKYKSAQDMFKDNNWATQ